MWGITALHNWLQEGGENSPPPPLAFSSESETLSLMGIIYAKNSFGRLQVVVSGVRKIVMFLQPWWVGEQVKHKSWTNCKLVVGKSWKSLEQVMNKSWTSHKQVMNKSWTSHGQVMNKSWTSHNKLWTIHIQLMNNSWATYEQVVN